MSSLISFWLEQCNPGSLDALFSLSQHGYAHDWMKHGDLGSVRMSPDGRNRWQPDPEGQMMIAQAIWEDIPCLSNEVDEPVLYDIICWHPHRPGKWYFYRGERGLLLGERNLWEAAIGGKPLRIHRTPFSWLFEGQNGVCLLDKHALPKLQGVGEVVCFDVEHGKKVRAALRSCLLKNLPKFSVPVREEVSA